MYKQNNVNLGVMDKIEHVKILLDSFEKLVQKQIIVRTGDAVKDLKLIDEGAFALVSHNGEKDPILNYGNQLQLMRTKNGQKNIIILILKKNHLVQK